MADRGAKVLLVRRFPKRKEGEGAGSAYSPKQTPPSQVSGAYTAHRVSSCLFFSPRNAAYVAELVALSLIAGTGPDPTSR